MLVLGTVDLAKPRLQVFWKYAKVELRPPSPAEFPQISQGFNNIVTAAKSGAWKKLTVRVSVPVMKQLASIG